MNTQWLKAFVFVIVSGQVSAQEESKSIFAKLKEKQANQTMTSQAPLSKEEIEYKRQFEAELDTYTTEYLKEFAEYKKDYNAKLAAYRAELLSQWGEVDVSTNSKVVDYTEQDVKTVVDFDKGEVVISVLHDEDSPPDVTKVERAVQRLSEITPDTTLVNNKKNTSKSVNILAELVEPEEAKAIIEDATATVTKAVTEKVVPTIDAKDLQTEKEAVSRIQKQDQQQVEIIADKADLSNEVIASVSNTIARDAYVINGNNTDEKTSRKQDQLKKKRITRYKIAVKGKSDKSRVDKVKPYADIHAEKWELPLALIIAIIHTESSFNPLAVSHIPAYGLMQIVPNSAGIDVNEFLNKKREPMETDILFQSDQNIRAGSAYLHILDSRYLRKITNQESRLYCVIAAYNTGVGNVSRAFNDGKSRRLSSDVLAAINGMAPEQVYEQLVKALPYEETRRYLKKVRTRMSHYEGFIASM